MTISADTLKSDIWNTFRTLIVNNVNSVTIKGKTGPNTVTVTVKNISSSFPDTIFNVEANYPMIVINSPDFNTNPVTFRNRELSGTIDFEIFTNQSESADKFTDLLNATIMNNEDYLNGVGLDELEISSTDSNHYDRNNMSVHSRRITWGYKLSW